ncbi:37S ribosomal protein MRP4, mitochondrial [Colletotrichum chlorophyti]|uniref:37S ribosomal protein MRP4, mitochondrial n=1 Tax=Colletotrichum chlorophyti TaxID=708187 RepID=A0A1Q8S3Q9_9PEZI|nr:37S ribosomal protein MRP4, mitochondrial [Colletotrichum chlorophyti]
MQGLFTNNLLPAGQRAVVAPVARSCHRAISTDTITGGITPEQLLAFEKQAAIDHFDRRERRRSAVKSAREAGVEEPDFESRDYMYPNFAGGYQAHRRVQKATRTIGSALSKPYVPSQLIKDPPKPEDVTLELLMASQTHMGHHTSRWNPANARYIYGVRQGIHIISLETTAAHLRRAARVVEEVAFRGGLILFVGTRQGQMDIVSKAAKLAGGCHLFTKWTPGNITNRDQINRGKPVKVVGPRDEKLDGFERLERTGRPLVPDLVVCLNPLENYTMLYECGLANVPTIGVIDTDANPDWVTYTIPANDDSFRSMAVIAGVLGRAGQQGQKRRLADAQNGVVAWKTPTETANFMALAQSKWGADMKKWRREMGDAASSREEKMLLDQLQVERTKAVDGELDA